jgi:AbrB family looped-hinge helix DNA binding protein
MVLFNGMKELTVPIDEAGRIVLPKGVRQELAIKAGDTLKVAVHGASVTLTPNREMTGLVRKGKALVFSSIGDETVTAEAVNRVLEEAREERHKRTAAGFGGAKREG